MPPPITSTSACASASSRGNSMGGRDSSQTGFVFTLSRVIRLVRGRRVNRECESRPTPFVSKPMLYPRGTDQALPRTKRVTFLPHLRHMLPFQHHDGLIAMRLRLHVFSRGLPLIQAHRRSL